MVALARICMTLEKNNGLPDVLAGMLSNLATSAKGRKRVVERVADKTPNLLAISICSVAKGAPSRSKCLKQKVLKRYELEDFPRITIPLPRLLPKGMHCLIWPRSLRASSAVERNTVSAPGLVRVVMISSELADN